MALLFVAAAVAAGVWSLVMERCGEGALGLLLLAAAAVAFFLAGLHGREWLRVQRLAAVEARWEWLRAVRPRI